MTDRELMQQALNALITAEREGNCEYGATEALRARLAQPEPAPITMVVSKTGDPSVTMSWWHEPALPVGTPLYTAPPQREWQSLTDEEIDEAHETTMSFYGFARAIEANLKEKNGNL
jgi:hypothetical protein